MNRKTSVLIGIVSVIGAGIIISMFFAGLKEEKILKPVKTIKRKALVREVRLQNNIAKITGSGRLSSSEQIDISSEVSGKIVRSNILLKEGVNFKKGDLIIKIYDKDTRLSLQAQKSRFLNSMANILADYRIDFPEEFNKMKNFFKAVNIKSDLPPLPEFSSEKEKIFLASKSLLTDYYTIKATEINLKKHSVYAPFDGSFTEVIKYRGSAVNPGSKIASIMRTDLMELEVPVKIDEAVWIKKNDKVTVKTKYNNFTYRGSVCRKNAFVSEDTQSISVFISLKSDKKHPLYKGSYYTVEFTDVVVEQSLDIPRSAVFNGNQVFTVEKNRLVLKNIDIIKKNPDTFIIRGLENGELVVSESLINAREKTEVKMTRE